MKDNKMGRTVWLLTMFLRLLARIHVSIFVSLGVCFAYTALGIESNIYLVFPRMMLFAIPASLSFYAGIKIKRLSVFILASLGLCGLAWLVTGEVFTMLPMAVICFFRGKERISEDKTVLIYDYCCYPIMVLFLAFFVLAAVNEWIEFQRLTLIITAVYFMMCLAWRGITRVIDYIKLNESMSGLPSKRIARTSCVAVAGLVIIAGLLLIPSAASYSGSFTMPQLAISDDWWEKTMELQNSGKDTEQESSGGGGMDIENMGGVGPEREFPPALSYTLLVVVGGGIAFLIIFAIYKMFKLFRGSFTDELDVVQHITHDDDPEDEAEKSRRKDRKVGVFDFSPSAQIRKRYKKLIIKHTQDKPKSWFTPEELEKEAGLDSRDLHRVYEKARYSESGVTAEEIRGI